MISNVFCFATLADKSKGTLYTDATGALPVWSVNGNQYCYVAYDYDTNYVHTVPVKDLSPTPPSSRPLTRYSKTWNKKVTNHTLISPTTKQWRPSNDILVEKL